MLTKIIVSIVMLIILVSLGCGLIFLVKDSGKTKRTVKSLTMRIALSVSLFIFLFIAFKFNWITPHALVAN